VVSQALTLYITPVIYIYFERLLDWTGHRRRQPAALASTPYREAAE